MTEWTGWIVAVVLFALVLIRWRASSDGWWCRELRGLQDELMLAQSERRAYGRWFDELAAEVKEALYTLYWDEDAGRVEMTGNDQAATARAMAGLLKLTRELKAKREKLKTGERGTG